VPEAGQGEKIHRVEVSDLWSISLILAYSFVFVSLTLSSTAVMLSKTQLGM